jgi:LPS export ABC transporter protein LptC
VATPVFYFKRPFFAGTIVIIFIFLSSCENDIATINLITTKSQLPAESGKEVEIIYSDSARIKMKLTSPQIDHYTGKKPYVEFPKGVKVEFYDRDMKVKSRLTSKYAIRRENEKVMEAKQDVVVNNEKGETLNTEHLIWDEQKDRIYTEEFVKITTKDEILFGDGLESNQEFTKYKIKNIKGTISLHENE